VPDSKTKNKRIFPNLSKKRQSAPTIPRIKPGADKRLSPVFSKIGVPEVKAFKPDPFQLNALSAIKIGDCLVSAPTGSGKTWIATKAIEDIRNNNGKAWYASPLKALTNSKYMEFKNHFGKENVGVVTGDRVENPDAPIIVGTTEILRNQLYDAMHKGEDLYADLVILDEAHFLGDEERGVVWEEIIIYLPVRIPLLLLSATIKNSHQISGWIGHLRGKKCVVIEEKERPVPLFPLFFHPTGTLLPLLGKKGLDEKVIRFLKSPKGPVVGSGRRLPPFGEILNSLRKYNLLPAIFFLKSRANCNDALDLCKSSIKRNGANEKKLNKKIDEFIKLHPHLKQYNQLWHLKNLSVGAHHSGQLPLWKLLIENLMEEGLLDAVFATSTVAAGVNVPARSIAFLNSDRYNGHKFENLTATELHQMTGRAGRRGMDNIGFAIVIPGPFMDVKLIGDLLKSPPEDILSQVKIDFSMSLNLLLSYRPEEIRDILSKSFAGYLNWKNMENGSEGRLKDAGKKLMKFLPQSPCKSPESALGLARKRIAVNNEIYVIRERKKQLEATLSKIANLVPGRLFFDKRSRIYCAIKRHIKMDNEGILACRMKHKPGGKIPPKMRFFTPDKILTILDRVIDVQSTENPVELRKLLSRVSSEESPQVMENLPLGEEEISKLKPLTDRVSFLEYELNHMPCKKCKHFYICHGKKNRGFRSSRNNFSILWDLKNAVMEKLWNDFIRHLNFLKMEGYIRENDTLSEDGRWASKLRIDQPLAIAEGLRLELFPKSDPGLLAALIATFVYDREMEIEFDESSIPKDLIAAYNKMKTGLLPLIERKTVHGFPARPMPLWIAATIYAWAKGVEWDRALSIADMAEGDLAMLISRTADNLRHLASLTTVYPYIAKTSAQAIPMILREPAIFE